MYTCVLLLQHSLPTALNMHVVATFHKNHDQEIATMLFWQYIACIFTLPFSIAVFLALLS